jgi:FdhE protein
MGFSPDLLWLIGELGSAPLAHCLAAGLKASTTTDAAGIHGADLPDPSLRRADPRTADVQVGLHWNRGYCPCCGSWPVFIEAGDAHTLRCSYCALGWSLAPHGCAYCGNVGADFVAAALDVGAPQQRVELCGACGGYTKVIDVREPTPFPLLAIGDLATMHLDHGAMARGYRRPVLFDLDAIEPRVSC